MPDYLDDDFEREENDDDIVVEDYLSGFFERRSDCVRQYGGWVNADKYDEDPKTEYYRQEEDTD